MKYFFAIAPFFFFIIGYRLMSHYYNQPITAPHIIGYPVEIALKRASESMLHLHLVGEVQDSNLPVNTVIQQIPAGGDAIKKYQALYCTVSGSAPILYAPQVIHKKQREIDHMLSEIVKIKYYYLVHDLPLQTCFAQHPLPGSPITNRLIIYIATEERNNLRICPSFIGKNIENIEISINKTAIDFEIRHKNSAHKPDKGVIIDQYPHAGSLLDLSKQTPCKIILYV